MTLDLETLYFASSVSRCAYLVVFLVTAFRQPGEHYLWHWIGALTCSMVGLFFLARIPPTEDLNLVSSVLINVICLASLSLSWSGLRHFYGRRTSPSLLVALTILPTLAYAAMFRGGLPQNTAITFVFASCMLLTGLSVREIVRPSQSERLWSQYVVATAFLGYFLIFAASIVTFALTDVNTRTIESGRLSMVVDQVTGVLIYFGYLAMAGERASLNLRRLAEIDPLTGLANRRGLEAIAWGRALASKADARTGVLLADIDHFKSINDIHGHQAGDMVLKAFSARLKEALRAEDIAVRWGGEEFLAVLPGLGIDQVASVAERLRSAIESAPFAISSGSIQVTVSIGITELRRDERDLEPATRRADAALYAAKTSGRNRVGRSDASAPQPQQQADPVPRASLAAIAAMDRSLADRTVSG